MPLSPSDVAYLNHLLDRHLKNQRSWPWMRYFILAMSVFMIAMAISAGFMAKAMAHLMDFEPPATQSTAAATRPVTQIELQAFRGTMEMQATMTAWSTTLSLTSAFMGVFFFFLGMELTGYALSKWNHHRRDAILITLLREKCAAELAPPTPPLKSDI